MTTVLVTRPRESFDEAVRVVESLGMEAIGAPFVELVPRDPERLRAFLSEARAGWVHVAVFTSANGVRIADGQAPGLWNAIRELTVVAIGPSTADAIRRRGIEPRVPDLHSSGGIVNALARDVRGKHVALLRSAQGSRELSRGILQAGGKLLEVSLYDVSLPRDVREQRRVVKQVANGACQAYTFTSRRGFENFLHVAGQERVEPEVVGAMRTGVVGAVGEPTAQAIRSNGLPVHVVPEHASFRELAEAMRKTLP